MMTIAIMQTDNEDINTKQCATGNDDHGDMYEIYGNDADSGDVDYEDEYVDTTDDDDDGDHDDDGDGR